MKEYFTYDRILYYLCRLRAKYAKQRGKRQLLHNLTNNNDYNHHAEIQEQERLLRSMLPPRRKWKKLKIEERYKNKYQKINSIEYNTKCILRTVKSFKASNSQEEFLTKLDKFILDIQRCIDDPSFELSPPEIYPKIKDKKDDSVICRPIAIYDLKDKIIISLTNKYLTDIFDENFYDKSHAFRAVRKDKGKQKYLITHHDSIAEIIDYKQKYKGERLWVAESDMSKFYDSVNHTVIKKQFERIVRKTEKNGSIVDERAKHIFNSYLNSYTFVRDVLPLNKDNSYWEDKKIPNGEYEWIKKQLLQNKFYKRIQGTKIGVPQGGALSGLIANIVLDFADQKIIDLNQSKLLYVRFCDDMIIMHPYKKVCANAIITYRDALIKLKLLPHPFNSEKLSNNPESYWNKKSKSKLPYKWTSNYGNKFNQPWIGFVGYEIHYDCLLRVRKSSLKKELQKQNEVISNIIHAIKKDKRARNGKVLESAHNRLIGMAVGRVQLWNYKFIEADMCWVNGFNKLNDNEQLRRQLRQLDKNRNHQIAKLKQELKQYKDPEIEEEEQDNRKIASFYGKPFSYYYQILKKEK